MLPLAALLLAAAPPPAAAPGPDIVVTGRDAEAARQEARSFVRQVSPEPVDGQFARWNQPVCAAVSGLPVALGRRVLARVRQIAGDAGVPLAKAGCRPNALVAFTPDARRMLANLERTRPNLLAEMPLAERPTLRTGPAPVRWWYSTLSENADGGPLLDVPSVAFGANGTGDPQVPTNGRTRFNSLYRSSTVSTGLRASITSAAVLVDVPAATGWRLDAIADYAAFVLLARTRPAAPPGSAETILRLFGKAEADRPRGLTANDRSYLAGLYATPADRTARAQGRAIAGAIARRDAAREDRPD